MQRLTYKKAGVDIEEGDRLVDLISPIARETFRKEVLADIGSFSALFSLDTLKYREPVLVSGTDGVGTKLKIAFLADKHDTIGIDLVAMCVNDILTSGAEPLFFLDYFATGRLDADRAALVIDGIARGCKEAGCSLIGGETAEMPGFYEEGQYDLAGFAVGVVEKNGIIDGSGIREGDAIIGISSSGLHSNGYSLARKALFDIKKINIFSYSNEIGTTLCEELLRPTMIYARAVNALKDKVMIKGMAHITGGGIPGNLLRILPEDKTALLKKGSWPVQAVFSLIRDAGNVPDDDMDRTFNMGIGYVMVVPGDKSDASVRILQDAGYGSYLIGLIGKGSKEVRYE